MQANAVCMCGARLSGPVPCSGARRLGKGLDEVSTAIHGGAAAVNGLLTGREFRAVLVKQQCYEIFHTFINISIPVPNDPHDFLGSVTQAKGRALSILPKAHRLDPDG